MPLSSPEVLRALSQLPCFVGLHSIPDDRLVWVNRIENGVDPAAVLGQPTEAVIVEADRPAWREWFRRAAYGREINSYSVRINVPASSVPLTLTGRIGPVIKNDAVAFVVTMSYEAAGPIASVEQFLLCDVERQAVAELLAAGRPLKSAAINARGVDCSPSSLRAVLAHLVNRGVLETRARGYVIAPQFMPLAEKLLRGGV